MNIRLGNRRFRFSLLGTVLVLACVAAGVRLGVWQLHRAAEKTALIEQFEQGAAMTAELSAANIATLPRYQRVHFSGRYDAQHQVLLDNMPSQGAAQPGWPGFRVLTPAELDGGGWVLVDRGWIAMRPNRLDLPTVGVEENRREIIGRLDNLPEPGVRLKDQATTDAAASWPRVLNFPRQSDLERTLDRSLPARIVRLDAEQPDGYERVWSPNYGMGPRGHLGYAMQWFALAAAALVIYLVLSFRRIEGA